MGNDYCQERSASSPSLSFKEAATRARAVSPNIDNCKDPSHSHKKQRKRKSRTKSTSPRKLHISAGDVNNGCAAKEDLFLRKSGSLSGHILQRALCGMLHKPLIDAHTNALVILDPLCESPSSSEAESGWALSQPLRAHAYERCGRFLPRLEKQLEGSPADGLSSCASSEAKPSTCVTPRTEHESLSCVTERHKGKRVVECRVYPELVELEKRLSALGEQSLGPHPSNASSSMGACDLAFVWCLRFAQEKAKWSISSIRAMASSYVRDNSCLPAILTQPAPSAPVSVETWVKEGCVCGWGAGGRNFLLASLVTEKALTCYSQWQAIVFSLSLAFEASAANNEVCLGSVAPSSGDPPMGWLRRLWDREDFYEWLPLCQDKRSITDPWNTEAPSRPFQPSRGKKSGRCHKKTKRAPGSVGSAGCRAHLSDEDVLRVEMLVLLASNPNQQPDVGLSPVRTNA